MDYLSSPLDRINPSGIYSYLDTVQLWVMQPLPPADIAFLRRQCGSVRVRDRRARWDKQGRYKQRLTLHQPTPEALRYFAGMNAIHINRVDVALDWTFDAEVELQEAWEIVCKTHVKPYHRDQGVRFVRGKKGEKPKLGKKPSRYTGQKWRNPQVVLAYMDKHCRRTGEVHCLHFDWCITGSQTLKRIGLSSINAILNLDFRRFWFDRLVFRAVAFPETLGRYHNNYLRGTKRRGPWIQKFGKVEYHMDRRAGDVIVRSSSTQEIIDIYRKKFRLEPSFWTLKESHLLPGHSYD